MSYLNPQSDIVNAGLADVSSGTETSVAWSSLPPGLNEWSLTFKNMYFGSPNNLLITLAPSPANLVSRGFRTDNEEATLASVLVVQTSGAAFDIPLWSSGSTNRVTGWVKGLRQDGDDWIVVGTLWADVLSDNLYDITGYCELSGDLSSITVAGSVSSNFPSTVEVGLSYGYGI